MNTPGGLSIPNPLELSVMSLKERRSRGFDPSLRKFLVNILLVHYCVSEPILKVGCKFSDLFFPFLNL
jgi:hypothetical protein